MPSSPTTAAPTSAPSPPTSIRRRSELSAGALATATPALRSWAGCARWRQLAEVRPDVVGEARELAQRVPRRETHYEEPHAGLDELLDPLLEHRRRAPRPPAIAPVARQ